MKKVYIGNAFSLSMLSAFDSTLNVQKVSAIQVAEELEYLSNHSDYEVAVVVGHADTAAILGHEIGRDLEVNRISVSLTDGDMLFVGQYIGPRLEEGATSLPPGARIQWMRVVVMTTT